jgi:hypothetical protein
MASRRARHFSEASASQPTSQTTQTTRNARSEGSRETDVDARVAAAAPAWAAGPVQIALTVSGLLLVLCAAFLCAQIVLNVTQRNRLAAPQSSLQTSGGSFVAGSAPGASTAAAFATGSSAKPGSGGSAGSAQASSTMAAAQVGAAADAAVADFGAATVLDVADATKPSPTAVPALSSRAVRKAVLIGINYIDTPFMLAGCIADIRHVERVLRANGWQEIVVLSDVDAVKPTRDAILRALRDAAAATQPGDVLYVHYSGHGGLLQAPVGRIEPSNKDSTLIPLDFLKAGHIRDFELKAQFFDVLPAGSTLFMVVDACHSGTIGDLRYNYADASFREVALHGASTLAGGSLQVETTLQMSPQEVAHRTAHALHRLKRGGRRSPSPDTRRTHARRRLSGGASTAADAAAATASAAVAAAAAAAVDSLPEYAQYFKPVVTHEDHVLARSQAVAEIVRTQGEWRARDIVPIEDTSSAPTKATVILLSGCRDAQTSADTAFDGEPSGACTWAYLVALCGSFKGTRIQPLTLRDLIKRMRGTLASSGYTQVPMLSCGSREKIDELTVRQLLKLDAAPSTSHTVSHAESYAASHAESHSAPHAAAPASPAGRPTPASQTPLTAVASTPAVAPKPVRRPLPRPRDGAM